MTTRPGPPLIVHDETDGSFERAWNAATHEIDGILVRHPPLTQEPGPVVPRGYEFVLCVNLGSEESPWWWNRRLQLDRDPDWRAYPAATTELTAHLVSLGYRGTVALWVDARCLPACDGIRSVLELDAPARSTQ